MKLKNILCIFPRKYALTFHANCLHFQSLVSEKIINLSHAELAQRVLKVKLAEEIIKYNFPIGLDESGYQVSSFLIS